MNGNNSETLSPKQVARIIDEFTSINDECIDLVREHNDEFLEYLSRVWEDQFAVDYVAQHNQRISEVVSGLRKNYNIFYDNVVAIAKGYAQAGGMNVSFPVQGKIKSLSISEGIVQDHFKDEDDRFGFQDINTTPDQILDAFKSLVKYLKSVSLKATSNIKSINAFGNQDVQLAVASSAGKVVDIFNEGIDKCKALIEQKIQEAKDAYKAVGANSTTSLGAQINSNNTSKDIIDNSNGIQSDGNHSEPGFGGNHSEPGFGGNHSEPGFGGNHSEPGFGGNHSEPGFGGNHSEPGFGGNHS